MVKSAETDREEQTIMTAEQIDRVLYRITRQILEKHSVLRDLVLVGIPTRGFTLAKRIALTIKNLNGIDVEVAKLDIRSYRDDSPCHDTLLGPSLDQHVKVEDKKVIMVDDVLYTGRSVRSALDALTDAGRPQLVQLAVLVDRGHRELPIRADYVGKNMPTARKDRIQVRVKEVDGKDSVSLIRLQV